MECHWGFGGMFHVKHGVSATTELFHVERRERMRSGGATNRIFTNFMVVWPFHVKPENSRKSFLTVGGMRLDFSIGHNA